MNTQTVSTPVEAGGAWTLGPAPRNYVIRNVRAVLDRSILDNARVVVRDGLIEDISAGPENQPAALDGHNLLLTPGFIDVHSDALERERMPRPNAEIPWEFAMASFEGKVAASGITTMFHGAGFQHQLARGLKRSADLALKLCAVVDTTVSYRVDNRVLHRLDIRSAEGAAVLRQRLESLPEGSEAPLVSHEDHTPGQGQYRDPRYLEDYIVTTDGRPRDEARSEVERLTRQAEETAHIRQDNLHWLSVLAADGRIRLIGHDPDTADAVDSLLARHGSVAEFPTTLDAARRARERGLAIVAGAPNVLRGRSHSGNVSAVELIAHQLVDALASDYLPAALLGAVAAAARLPGVGLPEAIALVTSGPARAAGLEDRGALLPGLRADFTLIDDSIGDWPRVAATMNAGDGTR